MLRGGVHHLPTAASVGRMRHADSHDIVDLMHHPDVEALRLYDHPATPLHRYPAILTAKAWLDGDLACFFAGFHDDRLYVLIFRKSDEFSSMHSDGDMRTATLGGTYRVSTGAVNRSMPRVEAVEPVHGFP